MMLLSRFEAISFSFQMNCSVRQQLQHLTLLHFIYLVVVEAGLVQDSRLLQHVVVAIGISAIVIHFARVQLPGLAALFVASTSLVRRLSQYIV